MKQRRFLSAVFSVAMVAVLNDGAAAQSATERCRNYIRNADAAISACTEVVREDKSAAWAYSIRGDAWNSKGNYDKAIADYSEAITLEPTITIVYMRRADAWKSKGDYDQAISDYREAIRLEPDYQLAINSLRVAIEEKAQQQQ